MGAVHYIVNPNMNHCNLTFFSFYVCTVCILHKKASRALRRTDMGTWCYLHLHLTCIALYRLFTTKRPSCITSLFQLQDYGIDFDDVDHPIKAFKCRCGSEYCRGKKRVSSKCLKVHFVLT
jgi:hypothetical protein